MENKKIITCDIDGILTDYPNCWLEYLKEKTGIMYKSIEEAKKNEVNYKMYKDMYRKSEYKASLPVNQHNKEVLNILSETYDIIFATSRPINDERYPLLKEMTYNWLQRNGLKFVDLIYKDEAAKFLYNLDVIFHIDDELKYAKKIYENFNGKAVYLLNNLLAMKDIEGITVIKDLEEIEPIPFFSVCIPATMRGKTIYRALKSVSEQTYKNFEVCIVDCASTDNTVLEIERFFKSSDFKNNNFKYRFVKKDYTPVGTEDWNDPLELAQGKYIAMLEGDDYWLPEHLYDAHSILINNPNIGIYGSSNLLAKRKFEGILYNNSLKEYVFQLKDGAVPPSESIFVRCDYKNNNFFYNSNDYQYSPEIGMYMEIALAGFDLYYTKKQDVYRETSSNPENMKTWHYFADRFTYIKKYSHLFKKKMITKALFYNGMLVAQCAFETGSVRKTCTLLKKLSKELNIIFWIACVIYGFLRKLVYWPIQNIIAIHHKIQNLISTK